jgi:TonB family protein
MPHLFEFLLRATVGSSLFYMMYWLLLRESTYFRANRFFLLVSVLLSVVVAAFPLKYEVLVSAQQQPTFYDLTDLFKDVAPVAEPAANKSDGTSAALALYYIYLAGIVVFASRLLFQSLRLFKIIYRSQSTKQGNYFLHENNLYSLPFSFFNHIFINPDYHKQEELDAILAHEEVHIRERHWIDLLIIELFTAIFWFNPFIWLIEHAIKQNHEYLADEGVLSRGHSPVRYQALLVNQLMGMQVIGLVNNLNFALGTTRLNMMKKQKTPRRKLLRMALGIPMATILLLAFAEPEYKLKPEVVDAPVISSLNDTSQQINLTGTVVTEDGKPLEGAAIVIKGTTRGTTAASDGKFEIKVPTGEKIALVASFVGYKTKVNELNISDDEKKFDYKFVMEKEIIGIDTKSIRSSDVPPPPRPPLPPSEKNVSSNLGEVFIVVEELPAYPNGHYGLLQYVREKQKVLEKKMSAEGQKLEGKATVGFTVDENGKVTNVQVLEKTTDVAADALSAIVQGMDDWSPGKQRDKPVPVNFAIPLEF